MQPTLCIVGLGYVGLPLAHAFAAKGYTVHGFDTNAERIAELQSGNDRTGELSQEQLAAVEIQYADSPECIGEADVVILAIPTPIDEHKKPDLSLLKRATETVAEHKKDGAIVVFESTVYPGTTEEICGPILGEETPLGYSPERINPGDKEHTISKIVKVVAGSDPETTDTLCELYGSIVEAGIHRAPNIKVAEMAKAIENAQRDLNIAFINEVAKLCDACDITTTDVLEAAGTKWNFLQFQPGLVGGHCIGVDPYYLVEKANQLDMETQVITAGRDVNDGMGTFVANQITQSLPNSSGAKVLVMGITFKEDVPDTRNSKVADVICSLQNSGCNVSVCDPFYDTSRIESMGHTPGQLSHGDYDAVALLVPHAEYKNLQPEEFTQATVDGGVIYDLKSALRESSESIQKNGRTYITL